MTDRFQNDTAMNHRERPQFMQANLDAAHLHCADGFAYELTLTFHTTGRAPWQASVVLGRHGESDASNVAYRLEELAMKVRQGRLDHARYK